MPGSSTGRARAPAYRKVRTLGLDVIRDGQARTVVDDDQRRGAVRSGVCDASRRLSGDTQGPSRARGALSRCRGASLRRRGEAGEA